MNHQTATARAGQPHSLPLSQEVRVALVRELQKLLFDQLGVGIKNTVQEVENSLFDAMEQAKDNESRSDYLESISSWRSQKLKVVEGFLRAHLDVFKAYFSGQAEQQVRAAPEEPGIKAVSLTLLKKEEQEESLLVNTMASRLNKKYNLELVVMRRRLAYLAGASYADETLSPLCPDAVAASLQQVMHEQGLSTGLKSTVYMNFDRQVMTVLQHFYVNLNQFFADREILPSLGVDNILQEMAQAQREQQPQQKAAEPAPAAENQAALLKENLLKKLQGSRGATPMPETMPPAAAQAMAQPPASTPYQQQVEHQVNEINQLLGNYRNSLGVVLPSGSRMLDSFAPPGASKHYSEQQLMQALQKMQRERAMHSMHEPQDTDAFKQGMYQTLAAATKNAKEFRIDGNQSNLIDLVGMLFDFVKEEDRLAQDHKDVLVHLQNLYCQVALRDASFFHNTSHPAHLLLNRMVQAGSQFQGDVDQKQLSNAIEETVRQALVEYQHDDHVFDRLLKQFEQQVSTVQNRVEKREKRAVDAAKGREKLIFARKPARVFIEVCVKRHSPPEIIREFLLAAWTDVLVFVFLRSGPSSAAWQEKARIAEDLAWSCTPLSDQQRQEFAARKEQHMAEIHKALQQLGSYSETEIQRVIQDIQICQQAVQAQQNEVVRQLNNTLASSMTAADEAELHTLEPVNETALDARAQAVLEQLKHVRFGTWFKFREPPHRLKLAWFSPTTQRYMFVDSSGQGSYIKLWSELFELMQKGDVSIEEKAESLPFFERALQAIQRTLKQFAGSYVSEIRDSKPEPA